MNDDGYDVDEKGSDVREGNPPTDDPPDVLFFLSRGDDEGGLDQPKVQLYWTVLRAP